MKSQFTNKQIEAVMAERGINRKSALKFLNREHVGKTATAVAPAKSPEWSGKEQGVPANPANAAIITEVPNAAKQTTKKAPAKAAKKSKPTDAVKARTAGTALFNLAGRPTKAMFIAVYGAKGHLMTWQEREATGIKAADFRALSLSNALRTINLLWSVRWIAAIRRMIVSNFPRGLAVQYGMPVAEQLQY